MRSTLHKRQLELRYFFIVLSPVCVFVIHEVVQKHMIGMGADVPVTILGDGSEWMEAVGRYRFLSAAWFFAALALLPVAALIRNLANPLERNTKIISVLIVLAITMLAVIPTIQQYATGSTPQIYHQVGKNVFETALSRGSLPYCQSSDDYWLLGRCGEIPVFSLFRRILDIVNALAGLAVGSLIVGMVLCLASRDTDDIEEASEELARNLRRTRHQLYLSSLILTSGMFFAASWMYWPMPLVSEAGKSSYNSLVSASALFTGTYFCLLMLSYFLPVAFILESRVKNLAERANRNKTSETFDVSEWRSSHGLSEGTGDILRAGFALSAPLLAAFSGGIAPIAG